MACGAGFAVLASHVQNCLRAVFQFTSKFICFVSHNPSDSVKIGALDRQNLLEREAGWSHGDMDVDIVIFLYEKLQKPIVMSWRHDVILPFHNGIIIIYAKAWQARAQIII